MIDKVTPIIVKYVIYYKVFCINSLVCIKCCSVPGSGHITSDTQTAQESISKKGIMNYRISL